MAYLLLYFFEIYRKLCFFLSPLFTTVTTILSVNLYVRGMPSVFKKLTTKNQDGNLNGVEML